MTNSPLEEFKGNYAIRSPTILSSTDASPTQTNSTVLSTSNASSSPPGPSTPPPRSRARYGDLGRVPLHRRGNSKTYERLEDLLREAGYKETRVFTPEAERVEAAASDKDSEDHRLSGMGAVIGFLNNLFPAGAGKPPGFNPHDHDEAYSPPRSPLDNRRSSSIPSLDGDPTPKQPRQVSEARQLLQNTYQRHNNNANIVQPRPSRAGAYLRHMASSASMGPPPRPNSTPIHSRPSFSILSRDTEDDDPSVIFSRKGNGEGEEDHRGRPPLPPSWLETVARAVLFGGSGAHVGGPINDTPSHHNHHHRHPAPPHPRKPQGLRPSRSSLSQVSSFRPQSKRPSTSARRSKLADQTNAYDLNAVPNPNLLAPPPIVAMLERGRAGKSESEVTRSRVMCRSAPGSRTSSLVRGEKLMRGHERGRGDKRRKGGDERDRVPSLARTQVEGDAWNHGKGRPSYQNMTATDVKNKYLNDLRVGGDTDTDGSDHEHPADCGTGSEEDDDEGELDLSRILLHPKRQQSIRSLRKHLALDSGRSDSAGLLQTGRGMSVIRPSPSRSASNNNVAGSLWQRKSSIDDEDTGHDREPWGGGWKGRRSSIEDDDEEAESFTQFFGRYENRPSGNDSGKTKLGFAQWGSRGAGS